MDAEVFDGEDLDDVEAERVRPVGGTGDEHALQRSVVIAAWMHPPNTSVREVQPGDHDDVVTGPQPLEGGPYLWGEHQPAVRSTFVALAGGRGEIGQG